MGTSLGTVLRLCGSAGRVARHSLVKGHSLVDQGTFPQQPAGSMFRLPISPMAQPPSIQVRAPGCVTAQPGELLAAIGVEIEVTLDVRRLQNRHNWIERCDRKRNIDANLPVTIQLEGFIRRATSDAKSRKISGRCQKEWRHQSDKTRRPKTSQQNTAAGNKRCAIAAPITAITFIGGTETDAAKGSR